MKAHTHFLKCSEISLYHLLIFTFTIKQEEDSSTLNNLVLEFTNILSNSGYFENSIHNNSNLPCKILSHQEKCWTFLLM